MSVKEKERLVSILRDRSLPIEIFRKTVADLVDCFAREYQGAQDVVLVSILRSGLAMLPPWMSYFPKALVGFLGMRRNEKTLRPFLYYQNLPPLHSRDKVLILDPMLATGGSMQLAIQLLVQAGSLEEQISVISLIGSKTGVAAVQKQFSKVQIQCAAIDEKIDSSGWIVPGLGDFGDRFFGTIRKETT